LFIHDLQKKKDKLFTSIFNNIIIYMVKNRCYCFGNDKEVIAEEINFNETKERRNGGGMRRKSRRKSRKKLRRRKKRKSRKKRRKSLFRKKRIKQKTKRKSRKRR